MRINFPLWLLAKETPVFGPGESNLGQRLSLIDRHAPLLLLYQTLIKLGHNVDRFEPGACDLNVFWTSKLQPESERERSIILEVAWIPRWTFQASPTGSNYCGHYARQNHFPPLGQPDAAFIREHLVKLRALFARSVNPRKVEQLQSRLASDVVLFPMQVANDFNLKFSDTAFASLYTTTDANNVALAQACVDEASRSVTAPLLFKQHPVDPTPGFKARLRTPHLVFDNADDFSTHEIFASGRCKAVIAVNSNTVHEAAVWNIPSICLGRLIWDSTTTEPPFSPRLADLDRVAASAPHEDPRVLSYLHYLVRHQWTLADFQNLLMVDQLVRTRGDVEPMALRRGVGLS